MKKLMIGVSILIGYVTGPIVLAVQRGSTDFLDWILHPLYLYSALFYVVRALDIPIKVWLDLSFAAWLSLGVIIYSVFKLIKAVKVDKYWAVQVYTFLVSAAYSYFSVYVISTAVASF